MSHVRSHRTFAAAPATLLIAAILVLTACSTARKTGITDGTLVERLAQARTPVDHENLAIYFDEQAAAAERMSAECRKLHQRYEHTLRSLEASGTAPGLLGHFNDLIENHRRNAGSYRALAAWHRRQATEGTGNKTGAE